MPSSRRAATIKDVAAAAGVGVATVSRVLSGTGSVSPATRERVLAAARDLEYRPSALGRSLKLQRTGSIGLVVPDITDPFCAELTAGVLACARTLGEHVLLDAAHDDPARETEIVNRLVEQRVDGVIALPAGPAGPWRAAARAGLAVVFADRTLPAVPQIPAVLADDAGGVRAAVEYLLGLGHRRIAFLGTTRPGTGQPRSADETRHDDPAGPDTEDAAVAPDVVGGTVASSAAGGMVTAPGVAEGGAQETGGAPPGVTAAQDWAETAGSGAGRDASAGVTAARGWTEDIAGAGAGGDASAGMTTTPGWAEDTAETGAGRWAAGSAGPGAGGWAGAELDEGPGRPDVLVADGGVREAAFRAALAESRVAVDDDLVVRARPNRDSAYAAAAGLFQRRPDVTAVLAASHLLGEAAVQVARELDLRVPGDLSIAMVDDVPWAELCGPPLTAVARPGRDIGYRACEVLLRDPAYRARGRPVVLPTELVIRGSCGPPALPGGPVRTARTR